MRTRLLAGVAALGVAGAGYVVWAHGESETTFCTTEGLITPNGGLYGRSHSRGCQFVDDDGNLVTEFSDGRPLCYVVIGGDKEGGNGVVDCDDAASGLEVRRPS